MSRQNKTNETMDELDETFEIFSLVNTNDIDSYLKVLMLINSPGLRAELSKIADKHVEEMRIIDNNSNALRAKMNHAMIKYIKDDDELKNSLKKNDYNKLDTTGLDTTLEKVKQTKIAYHKKNLTKAFKLTLGPMGGGHVVEILEDIYEVMDFEKWNNEYSYNEYVDVYLPQLRIVYNSINEICKLISLNTNLIPSKSNIVLTYSEDPESLQIRYLFISDVLPTWHEFTIYLD